mgnify:CR=1 FL=1
MIQNIELFVTVAVATVIAIVATIFFAVVRHRERMELSDKYYKLTKDICEDILEQIALLSSIADINAWRQRVVASMRGLKQEAIDASDAYYVCAINLCANMRGLAVMSVDKDSWQRHREMIIPDIERIKSKYQTNIFDFFRDYTALSCCLQNTGTLFLQYSAEIYCPAYLSLLLCHTTDYQDFYLIPELFLIFQLQ